MKFWKNHEDMIKKAVAVTGAAAVVTAAAFGIFFLMNKQAVMHYISKKTGSETIKEAFENNYSEIAENGEAESETDKNEMSVLEGEAFQKEFLKNNLSEGSLSEDDLSKEGLTGEHPTEGNVNTEEKEPLADDLRIHGFPYIELTSQLNVGDYVDVRIAFADGEDFVLLSKKQIQGIAPLRDGGDNALWLIVSEEEILRLAGAVADVCLHEGSSIYAIEYVSEEQKAAKVNYAVRGSSAQKENEAAEMVYPEQEEILYLD